MKLKPVHVVGGLAGLFLLIQLAGFLGVKYGLTNVAGVVDEDFSTSTLAAVRNETPLWSQGEEWQVFKEAIIKDAEAINRAAREAEVSPWLLMTVTAVEQLRLYHSEREIFKQAFAPLKILGSQVQFSWGVAGIKQETARAVENNLKDSASPYYLGPRFEKLLDFSSLNPDNERFQRLIDEKDHYYSYLYAALFIKQVETQWQRAGFPINNRPEILATLYNIGFANSQPKPEPQVGGAAIEIGEKTYSFGGLAYEIYVSEELADVFPLK